jgi:hypothetical protein
VSVALVIQHEKSMRRIILLFVACPDVLYFMFNKFCPKIVPFRGV